jgi:hypothetical protein
MTIDHWKVRIFVELGRQDHAEDLHTGFVVSAPAKHRQSRTRFLVKATIRRPGLAWKVRCFCACKRQTLFLTTFLFDNTIGGYDIYDFEDAKELSEKRYEEYEQRICTRASGTSEGLTVL